MLIKNLKRDRYRMEMVIELSEEEEELLEELSQEFVMNEIVKFQIRVVYTPTTTSNRQARSQYATRFENIVWIFGKFVNITKNTTQMQMKLTSKVLNLKDIRVNVDSKWHLLTDNYVTLYKFDVCFTVEIEGGCAALSASLEGNCMNKLKRLHDDELTDFEIRGDDGSIRVHKYMLAAVSPVFHKMMEGDWKEIKEGCMHLEGMSKATLQDFKTYIYLNTLPPTVSKNILIIAMRYDIPDMEIICIKHLAQNLEARNMRDLIEFAIIHKNDGLLVAILERVKYGYIKVRQIKQHILDGINNETCVEDKMDRMVI